MKKLLFICLLAFVCFYQTAQAQGQLIQLAPLGPLEYDHYSELDRGFGDTYSRWPVTVLATVTAKPAVWVTLLASGQALAKNVSLSNENGSFVFQKDGNVVLYDKNKKPMWASNTFLANTAIMDAKTGIFAVHDGKKIVWSSNTTGAGAFLQIDWTSYTLRIVDATGTKELWRSKK